MLRTICSLFLIKLKSFHFHKNSHNTILFSLLHHCCFGDLSFSLFFLSHHCHLELWFFFSFSSHTIVTWSFEFFLSFSSCTIVAWSFEFFLHTSPNKPTHKHSHTHWKLQAYESNAKPKLGKKLIFTPCYFHFYFLRTLLWFSSLIIPKLTVFTPQSQLEELCNNFIF